RLLQRYSLVAFLSPEIRRAMLAAREKGSAVEAIVTCGNLPDLRSMTMPLIEELDVEVETLDSLEGLGVKPAAADRLSEMAPTIRIACAGAIARPTRPNDPSKKPKPIAVRLLPAAAVVLGLAGPAWVWSASHRGIPAKAPPPAPTKRAPAPR